MKKEQKASQTKHLEDALFTNPIASNTDTTGYVPVIPNDKDTAENLSEMMNVPVSMPPKTSIKNKTEHKKR